MNFKNESYSFKEKFPQKHVILFSIIISIAFVLIFGIGIITIFLNNILPYNIARIPGISYMIMAINNIFAGLFVLLIMKIINPNNNISWNYKGIINGLILGFSIILFSIVQILIIVYFTPNKTLSFEIFPIISSIIYCISIGFWEELLCRGLLFHNMLEKWGNNKKGVFKSAILSALIFGALHLISVVNGIINISSLAQVLYASISGILFSAIYLRSKSILSVILLHIILNISAYLLPTIMKNVQGLPLDIFLIVIILFSALWLAFAFFLLVKSNVKDVKELIYRN